MVVFGSIRYCYKIVVLGSIRYWYKMVCDNKIIPLGVCVCVCVSVCMYVCQGYIYVYGSYILYNVLLPTVISTATDASGDVDA